MKNKQSPETEMRDKIRAKIEELEKRIQDLFILVRSPTTDGTSEIVLEEVLKMQMFLKSLIEEDNNGNTT